MNSSRKLRGRGACGASRSRRALETAGSATRSGAPDDAGAGRAAAVARVRAATPPRAAAAAERVRGASAQALAAALPSVAAEVRPTRAARRARTLGRCRSWRCLGASLNHPWTSLALRWPPRTPWNSGLPTGVQLVAQGVSLRPPWASLALSWPPRTPGSDSGWLSRSEVRRGVAARPPWASTP